MSISFRVLLPSEITSFAAHLKRLDNHDRILRFEASVSDQGIDKYAFSIKISENLVLGAFDEDGILRGAAHVALSGSKAELGISVEKHFRGKGIGSELISRSLDKARMCGATQFTSYCLRDNSWMTRKMLELGCVLKQEDSVLIATTELPPADPILFFKDMTKENLGWFIFGHNEIQKMVAAQ